MSIIDETLVGKTKFTVRCSVDFDVEVEDKPPESNGYRTGMGRAIEKARGIFGRHIATFKNTNAVKLKPYSELDEMMIIDAGLTDESWQDIQGRLFDTMLFMGSGDYSGRAGYILQERLRSALSWSCFLQQGPDCEDGCGNQYIDDVVRDIAMALTGKEITFVEK
jgi:hypothetical protein